MELDAETGQPETLAERAARIKAEVLAGIPRDPSPEEIRRLADQVRELHRIEALIAAGGV